MEYPWTSEGEDLSGCAVIKALCALREEREDIS